MGELVSQRKDKWKGSGIGETFIDFKESYKQIPKANH